MVIDFGLSMGNPRARDQTPCRVKAQQSHVHQIGLQVVMEDQGPFQGILSIELLTKGTLTQMQGLRQPFKALLQSSPEQECR